MDNWSDLNPVDEYLNPSNDINNILNNINENNKRRIENNNKAVKKYRASKSKKEAEKEFVQDLIIQNLNDPDLNNVYTTPLLNENDVFNTSFNCGNYFLNKLSFYHSRFILFSLKKST